MFDVKVENDKEIIDGYERALTNYQDFVYDEFGRCASNAEGSQSQFAIFQNGYDSGIRFKWGYCDVGSGLQERTVAFHTSEKKHFIDQLPINATLSHHNLALHILSSPAKWCYFSDYYHEKLNYLDELKRNISMTNLDVKDIVTSYACNTPFKTSDFIEWVKNAKKINLDFKAANTILNRNFQVANLYCESKNLGWFC
ncbi:MAG: hypothetical protein JKX76_09315 [Colwellia sp.]|nr:hypothetical protein [Colwellia sp.]